MEGSSAGGAKGTEGRWRAFAVVAPAIFITVLDLFIVNVAFPSIRRDFSEASLPELSWVLTAYTIVFAALLVPMGKLGDVIGRRRVFQFGGLLFVIGSALCAAAPSVGMLIGARVIQGIGAAAITPTSLGLVLPMFARGERVNAVGAWAALGGVGAAMGPPLGGLLTQASWRWIFLVNVPIGLITLYLAHRRLRETRDARALMPDAVGSVLAVATVGLLVLGIAQGHDWNWDSRIIASFAAALVLGVLFVARSLRHPAPVIELDLFRAPEISLASLGQALFYAGFGAFLLGGVLFLTTVWHYSVLRAGFAFAPGPVMAALFAGLSSPFAKRFGPAAVGAPGAIMFGLGGLWFTGLGAAPHYTSVYLPALLFGGTGVGLVVPSFTACAVTAIPLDRLATGIAGVSAFRQIGAAVGVAMFVAVFGTPLPQQVLHAFDKSFLWMGICSFASAGTLAVLAVIMRRRAEPAAAVGDAVPDTVPEDLALSSRQS